MPDRDPATPKWDVPLGFIGIGAMAIVGGAAYTLGELTFYGYEFLPYWPMVGGWMVGMTVLAAAFGTFAECLIWNRKMARGLPFESMWRSAPGALAAAGVLVALAIAGWAATTEYQCAVVNAPFIALLAFAAIISLQAPIVHVLRPLGRPVVALVALLLLEASLMFTIGEGLAVDHYRKGLEHFKKDHQAEWTIGSNDDFHIDYARREIVLRTNAGAVGPREIRRSLAGFVCQ